MTERGSGFSRSLSYMPKMMLHSGINRFHGTPGLELLHLKWINKGNQGLCSLVEL